MLQTWEPNFRMADQPDGIRVRGGIYLKRNCISNRERDGGSGVTARGGSTCNGVVAARD